MHIAYVDDSAQKGRRERQGKLIGLGAAVLAEDHIKPFADDFYSCYDEFEIPHDIIARLERDDAVDLLVDRERPDVDALMTAGAGSRPACASSATTTTTASSAAPSISAASSASTPGSPSSTPSCKRAPTSSLCATSSGRLTCSVAGAAARPQAGGARGAAHHRGTPRRAGQQAQHAG